MKVRTDTITAIHPLISAFLDVWTAMSDRTLADSAWDSEDFAIASDDVASFSADKDRDSEDLASFSADKASSLKGYNSFLRFESSEYSGENLVGI